MENNWINYWNQKNIWTESDLWKKNVKVFLNETSHILNYNKESVVLDIGCGNGDYANELSSKVDKIYCIDVSEEYVNSCKARFSNNKNIKVLKLSDDYTNLSFLKENKFSIIIVNSVVQYFNSQQDIIDLVKSIKKISSENAYLLISDIEVNNNKIKSNLKLIYNSIFNGYFFSLIKMFFNLFKDKKYSQTLKLQSLLIVNLDKLIKDLSIFVREVIIIKNNITTNVDRKHLLIKL